MARYEVFIPAVLASEFNVTLRVEADNWLAALKSGLGKLGEAGTQVVNIMVDVMEDNSIHVTDSGSGRVFCIKELDEATPTPTPPPAAPLPLTAPVTPAPLPLTARVEAAPLPLTAPVAQAPMPLTAPVEAAPLPLTAPVAQAPMPLTHPIPLTPAAEAPAPKPSPAAARPAPEPVRHARPAPQPKPVEARHAPSEPVTIPEMRRVETPVSVPAPARRSAEPARPAPKRETAEARKVEQIAAPSKPVQGKIGRSRTELQVEDLLSELFERTQDIYGMSRGEALSFLLDLAMEKIPSDAGSVFVSDLATMDLALLSARGPKGPELEKMKLKVPMGVGIVGFCAQEAVSVAISDTERDPRFYRKVSERIGYSSKSILCAPMVSGGRTFGCLEIINKRGSSHFTDAELAILGYVAHQGARYLEQT